MVFEELKRGIVAQNPITAMVLGLCPALAVSYSVRNALAISVAVLCVLAGTNMVLSLLRRILPAKYRMLCVLTVAAVFTTMIDSLMHRYVPGVRSALGIYVPLIAVNCLVIVQAEQIALKNGMMQSLLAALAAGAGFAISIVAIGLVRELGGNNTLLGWRGMSGFEPLKALAAAPGAFFLLAMLVAIAQAYRRRKGRA